MAKTITAFNVATQQDEVAEISLGKGNEFIITFSDMTFFKLPSTLGSKEELDEQLLNYKNANIGQILAADVEEEQVKNQALLDSL